MAAPALDVDHEAVKAHALQHGVRQAARDFNLPEETVKKWSQREGWLKACVPIPVPTVPLPASIRPIAVPNVPKASVAASTALERYEKGGKLALAKTVRKTAVHLSRMRPGELVERVPAIAGLATAHAKLFPEQGQSGPLVSIQLLTVEQPIQAQVTTVEHAPMLDLPE